MDAMRMLPASIAPIQGRGSLVVSMTLHGAVALALLAPWTRAAEDVTPPVVVELMTLAEESAPAAASAAMPIAPPTQQPSPRNPPRPVAPQANPVRPPPTVKPALPASPAETPGDASTASETTASVPAAASTADTPAVGTGTGTGTMNGGGTADHGQGEGIAAPGYTLGAAQTPAPDYPWSARRRGVEGRVVVRLEVGADGCPTQVELVHSSGSDTLDQAAIFTVWHWRLHPALAGGVPVAGRVVVPIVFKLT